MLQNMVKVLKVKQVCSNLYTNVSLLDVSAKNIIRTLTSATIKYDFISKSIEAPVRNQVW